MSSRNRTRCPKCCKKLSYSAYKRHQNPLYCPPGTSSEEASQSILIDHDGPDDGSDSFQTEGKDISDVRNYDHGESEEEEVIQKISDEWSGSVSSDKESDLENHEQENEAQVVDNIDDIDQEMCVQPISTDMMPDDVSHYESASRSMYNSTNALSTTNHNVNVAGEKSYGSLSSLVLQPLAIGLVVFQLVYKVSDRGIEFVLKDYQTMQEIIDSTRVPPFLGRIPHKIESKVSSLTADQWKNWVLVYSVPILHTILSLDDLRCWSHFVEACSLLLKPIVTIDDVIKGDEKLTAFCNTYEKLYGKNKCTPNMHLHLHLKDCMLDYGPVHSFWCFPFERYNGVFESFQKNWICPELQVMTKFLNFQEAKSQLSMTGACIEWLHEEETSCQGSIQQTLADPNNLQRYSRHVFCSIEQIDATNSVTYEATSKVSEKLFSLDEVEWLRNVYLALYPLSKITHVFMAHDVFNEVSILGEKFLSVKARGNSSHSIIAYWPKPLEGRNFLSASSCEYRAGEVQYFFYHTVAMMHPGKPESHVTHVFAYVHWYENHPYQDMQVYPMKTFTNITKKSGPSVFLPLSRIINQCAELNTTQKFDFGVDNVLVLCPVNRKIQLFES
ncbi:hypothetical protein EMCRGX_G011923 [Ephydatia muelleri]